MRSRAIVVLESAGKDRRTLHRSTVRPYVHLFSQGRLNEALDFAVGPRRIGPGAAVPDMQRATGDKGRRGQKGEFVAKQALPRADQFRLVDLTAIEQPLRERLSDCSHSGRPTGSADPQESSTGAPHRDASA
jgi:hypothetical protein